MGRWVDGWVNGWMDGKRNMLIATTGTTTKEDHDQSLLRGLRTMRQGMSRHSTKFGSALLHSRN